LLGHFRDWLLSAHNIRVPCIDEVEGTLVTYHMLGDSCQALLGHKWHFWNLVAYIHICAARKKISEVSLHVTIKVPFELPYSGSPGPPTNWLKVRRSVTDKSQVTADGSQLPIE
jgi:hypothetical protein